MGYSKVALEEKILGMYPEIAQYGIAVSLDFSAEKVLTRTALSSFSPYTTLAYGEDQGCVIPCFKDTCHEPIDNPDSLRSFLKKRDYLPDVTDINK